MSFLRSRSPSPAAALVGGNQSHEGPNVAHVQRVNVIMENLGVSPSFVATEIHSHPESMHVIAPQDLDYLAEHAALLAHHKDVHCDYKAFALILWGILGRVEASLDRATMLISAAAVSDGSPGGGLAAGQNPKSPPTGSSTAAKTGAPAKAAAAAPTLSKLSGGDIKAIPSTLLPVAREAIHVIRILSCLEVPEDEEGKVPVSTADVELLLRLAKKMVTLVSELVADGAATSARLSVVRSYSVDGQRLLKRCEMAMGALWLYLGLLTSRRGVDLVPVLGLFNEEAQWAHSGLGRMSTDAYCRAVAALSQNILSRAADFEDGERVVAELLFNRVGRRPPYRAKVFKMLHYSPRAFQTLQPADLPHNDVFGLLLVFSQLREVVTRSLTLEGASAQPILDDTHPAGAAEDRDSRRERSRRARRLALVRACRRHLEAHISRLPSAEDGVSASEEGGVSGGGTVLSYGQLLILAAVVGMPYADFTDDVALTQRAEATRLVAGGAGGGASDVGIVDVAALRLLLAYAYTMPTSEGEVEHVPLSPGAALPLYRAIATYFFQEPAFHEANRHNSTAAATTMSPRVNPALCHPLLRHTSLIQLLIGACEDELALAGEEGTAGSGDAAEPTIPAEHVPLDPGDEHGKGQQQQQQQQQQGVVAPPVGEEKPAADVRVPIGAPAPPPNAALRQAVAAELLFAIGKTVAAVYGANDALYERAALGGNFRSSLFAAVPEPVKAVNSLTAMLCFAFLDNVRILKQVNPTTALDTMTHAFAVFSTSALLTSMSQGDGGSVEQQVRKRLLIAMQRRLAYLPQQMCATDVETVLVDKLAPRATLARVRSANRIRLAVLEAYLRSMATSAAAFSVSDHLLLKHWIDVALPSLTSRSSAALAIAAHDFFIAPFLAQKPVSPLFVPTYVAVFVPVDAEEEFGRSTPPPGRYPDPPVVLVKRFAATVRAACQGIERCDGTALRHLLDDSTSAVSRLLHASGEGGHFQAAALKKITPTSAVLLVVAALFDKLCTLWTSRPGYVTEAQQRFAAYFSALANLLQCTDTQVLQRVCASLEALEVEQLRGAGEAQRNFLKYIGAVVDNVRGNSKKGVAEWFLRLSDKVMEGSGKGVHRMSKL